MTGVKLAGVRVKIERAEKHISDLNVETIGYFQSPAYEIRPHRDPESRRPMYVLINFKELPDPLPAIVGDVVQNLRAALDHMAYLLFSVHPGFKPDKSFFPIAENSTKYEAESLGKIKGFWDEGIKAVSKFEPYGGGKGETLWKLHSLSIRDKHRLLLTVLSQYRSFSLNPIFDALGKKYPGFPTFSETFKSRQFVIDVQREFSVVTRGMVLFVDAPDAEVNNDMKFHFEIVMNESGIFEGKPLLPALQGMCDFVKNVVSDLAPML